MKFTANLALALTVIVLLAVGAVGFADKTQELADGQKPSTQEQQHQMDGGGAMDGKEHNQTDDGETDGTDHNQSGGIEGMGH